MRAILFNNGNTGFFDYKGEQVAELQQSWLLMYVNFLKEKGIDPTKIDIELPCGKVKIFEIPGGYNWQIL
jgi:hypothetical protein